MGFFDFWFHSNVSVFDQWAITRAVRDGMMDAQRLSTHKQAAAYNAEMAYFKEHRNEILADLAEQKAYKRVNAEVSKLLFGWKLRFDALDNPELFNEAQKEDICRIIQMLRENKVITDEQAEKFTTIMWK